MGDDITETPSACDAPERPRRDARNDWYRRSIIRLASIPSMLSAADVPSPTSPCSVSGGGWGGKAGDEKVGSAEADIMPPGVECPRLLCRRGVARTLPGATSENAPWAVRVVAALP